MALSNSKQQKLLEVLAQSNIVGRLVDDVANEVGYTSGSMRNVIGTFRKDELVNVRLNKGEFASVEITPKGNAHLGGEGESEVVLNENTDSTVPDENTAPDEGSAEPTTSVGGPKVSSTAVNVEGDIKLRVAVSSLKVEDVLETVSSAALRAGGLTGQFVITSDSPVKGKALLELALDSELANNTTMTFKSSSAAKRRPLSGG